MESFKNINKKTKFKYKTVGYDCTTYANGNDFIHIKNGKLYTNMFSKLGMEWNENSKTWIFDDDTGLITYIVEI